MESAPGADESRDEGVQEDPAAQPEPPAVEPVQGDQGEQAPTDAAPVGDHDPSEPRATSAAPASDQSGVPAIPDGANEGVESPAPEGEQPAEGDGEQG